MAFGLGLLSAAAAACGGGNAAKEPASKASPPAAPASPEEEFAAGIALGNFDAGPDARWVRVDAAAFAGKEIRGRLAPELIQKVVRANFDPLRKCYEAGLGRNANLQGTVAVKFVIDVEGHVASAADFKSDLPDPVVVKCVVDGYRKLQFPRPEGGGIVTVVYPIVFNPGD